MNLCPLCKINSTRKYFENMICEIRVNIGLGNDLHLQPLCWQRLVSTYEDHPNVMLCGTNYTQKYVNFCSDVMGLHSWRKPHSCVIAWVYIDKCNCYSGSPHLLWNVHLVFSWYFVVVMYRYVGVNAWLVIYRYVGLLPGHIKQLREKHFLKETLLKWSNIMII